MSLGEKLARSALVGDLCRYNHVAGIGINGECLPQDGNALTLSDEPDALGVPQARINSGYGPNEQAFDRHAAFPSSLAANPALTIMALSLRTAARMLA